MIWQRGRLRRVGEKSDKNQERAGSFRKSFDGGRGSFEVDEARNRALRYELPAPPLKKRSSLKLTVFNEPLPEQTCT